MTILNSKLPRRHKKLEKFSYSELDEAEEYLSEKNLIKTPLATWICLAAYPILKLAENPIGKLVDPIIERIGNDYVPILILIIPLYAAVKIRENHFVKITLDYFENQKNHPKNLKKTSIVK